MDNKEFSRSLIAGSFFIIGIILIGVVIFIIGSDKGLTQSKSEITVLFKNIGGLTESAPVLLSGVNVGTVSSIDFLDHDIQGYRVAVKLNIYSKYKNQLLKPGIYFSIKTEGILGEKIVEIYFEENDPRVVDLSQPIFGEEPFDVQNLAEVFSKAAEAFTGTAQQLSRIDMIEFSGVMEESARALLKTSKSIDSILEEMHEISKKSKRLLDRVEQKLVDDQLFKIF